MPVRRLLLLVDRDRIGRLAFFVRTRRRDRQRLAVFRHDTVGTLNHLASLFRDRIDRICVNELERTDRV